MYPEVCVSHSVPLLILRSLLLLLWFFLPYCACINYRHLLTGYVTLTTAQVDMDAAARRARR